MTEMNRFLLFLCCILGFSEIAQTEPLPELHAKVREPVLQELMGGCSLRCAFFWETWAGSPPSPLKPSSELCDDDAMTSWISTTPGSGEHLEFRVPKHLPRDCRDTPFYGISIASGVIRSLQEFHAYARVKTMSLSIHGKAVARLHLDDTWRWQDFTFPDVSLNQGDIISLTIDELFPGKGSQYPGITEIVLRGAH